MAEAAESHDDLASTAVVAEYKTILQRVLEARPSGTRQRIATALAKHRSFVTQITSPAYDTPIPARHVELILEICHFSPTERDAFLAAYSRAHPSRHTPREGPTRHAHIVHLPDLGSAEKNRRMDALIGEFVEKLANLIADSNDNG